MTPAPPTNTAGPSITGTPLVGQSLTCDSGTWTGDPTFTYAWLADGTAIAGATAQSYVPTRRDNRSVLQCEVTAANAGGSTIEYSPDVVVQNH